MKKLIYIIIATVLLYSCGPHRMKCGARGICDTPKTTKEIKSV